MKNKTKKELEKLNSEYQVSNALKEYVKRNVPVSMKAIIRKKGIEIIIKVLDEEIKIGPDFDLLESMRKNDLLIIEKEMEEKKSRISEPAKIAKVSLIFEDDAGYSEYRPGSDRHLEIEWIKVNGEKVSLKKLKTMIENDEIIVVKVNQVNIYEDDEEDSSKFEMKPERFLEYIEPFT